jgi:ATP-binding cassette subfamily A (ABC1) protein 3
MQQTIKVITGFENNGLGITMSTIDKEYRNYSVLMGLYTFVISFFLMVLIGLYLEHVVPREHGKRYHPCFCFMKTFWCNKSNKVKDKDVKD